MGFIGDFIDDVVDFIVEDVLGIEQPDTDIEQGRTGNVRSSDNSQVIIFGRVIRGGVNVYVNGTGADNTFLSQVLVLASHECERIGSVFYDRDLVFDRGIVETGSEAYNIAFQSVLCPVTPPPVSVGTSTNNGEVIELGGQIVANNYMEQSSIHLRDGSHTTAVDFIVEENPNWTTSHKILGHSFIFTQLEYDPEVFESFIPTITVDIYGRKDIYDPRINQERWTMNPALICAWVLENLVGISRDKIDQASLIEAANICEEVVLNRSLQDEYRYTYNGAIIDDGDWEEWITPIVTAMAGACVEFRGIYFIRAGAWREPTLTITDSDILSAFSRSTSGSERERANSVKGTYISPYSYESSTEYPSIRNPIYLFEDGGVENFLELDLPNTVLSSTAQRLANIHLEQARRDETFKIEVPLRIGLDVMPFENVIYQSDLFGVEETYQVIEHRVFQKRAIGVELTLKAHSPDVYDWFTFNERVILDEASQIPTVSDSTDPTQATFTLALNSSHPTAVNLGTSTFFWFDPVSEFDSINVFMLVTFEYRGQLNGSPLEWRQAEVAVSDLVPAGVQTSTLELLLENPSQGTDNGYEFRNPSIDIAQLSTRFADGSIANAITPVAR